MQDVKYVQQILSTDYSTERQSEIPYPDMGFLMLRTTFDYLSGTVEGEVPNGSKSREGNDYLWFQFEGKSILSHRFIVAVTLGKWPPRDFDVDHVNHNPSDNRPQNLRVVTPRDNQGNRRKVLLTDLAEIGSVAKEVSRIKAARAERKVEQQEDDVDYEYRYEAQETERAPFYTGNTQPGIHSGVYHETSIGSWHWKPE